MPTIIKIKTFMCPNGIGQLPAICRFHLSVDNLTADTLCPNCHLELQEAVLPQDQMTVTIRDESDFDDEDLVEHEGQIRTKDVADMADELLLQGHLKKLNEQEAVASIAKGEIFVPITKDDEHGFTTPERKPLTQKQRDFFKAQVRSDIIKFTNISAST